MSQAPAHSDRVDGLVARLRPRRTITGVAAAWVADAPGARFDEAGCRAALYRITERGGLPILFPSYGLTALSGADWAAAHARLGEIKRALRG